MHTHTRAILSGGELAVVAFVAAQMSEAAQPRETDLLARARLADGVEAVCISPHALL